MESRNCSNWYNFTFTSHLRNRPPGLASHVDVLLARCLAGKPASEKHKIQAKLIKYKDRPVRKGLKMYKLLLTYFTIRRDAAEEAYWNRPDIFVVFFTTNSWLMTEGLCCIVEFDITSAPMQYNLYTDVVFLLFSKNIGELAIKARTRERARNATFEEKI